MCHTDMTKKSLILILPLTILIFGSLSAYSFITSTWPVSLYFTVIFIVSIYTARQSLYIQTALFNEIDDLNQEEINELSMSIIRDFGIFLSIHGAITTVIYLALYWLSTFI